MDDPIAATVAPHPSYVETGWSEPYQCGGTAEALPRHGSATPQVANIVATPLGCWDVIVLTDADTWGRRHAQLPGPGADAAAASDWTSRDHCQQMSPIHKPLELRVVRQQRRNRAGSRGLPAL